jgi:hypothetical protein
MATAVEAAAREGRLAALQAAQERLRSSEVERWDDPAPEHYPAVESVILDEEDRQRRTLEQFEDPGELVRAFRAGNLSWLPEWGPDPDSPGCLIPLEVR